MKEEYLGCTRRSRLFRGESVEQFLEEKGDVDR